MDSEEGRFKENVLFWKNITLSVLQKEVKELGADFPQDLSALLTAKKLETLDFSRVYKELQNTG